jgi:hypothetical protein
MEIHGLIQRFGQEPSGEILRTQTSFIDIVLASDRDSVSEEKIRIHYDQKREFNLSLGRFSSISHATEHPLLIDYLEPKCSVELGCYVEDKEQFCSLLESIAMKIFDGWRSFESYLNMPLDQFLTERYGILMFAPKSFATVVVEESAKIGIKLSAKQLSDPEGSPEVLILDRRFVIADGFKVQQL